MAHNSTVFIVDDDSEVRQSWECILQAADLPTRSFASAEDFLEQADLQQPGCLILDLRMPGMGGQRLLETLRQRDCHMPVIVITAYADVPTVIHTMKLGLVDFCTKPVDPAVLITRIRDLLREASATRDRQTEKEAALIRLATLSQREQEVLRLLIQGRLHKQIARELGISSRTVDHHRTQINTKLNATSLADLVRTAFIAGLQ